ncbi:GerW family sporulation protein [Salinibacillus xinjiangensis]|uniref:Sporulation protein YtfJ n=1 Tax=Salinibacillus xinjiangensis TaxID=1229268 RepID=A0A6G1X9V6_9BACI|nr:GerW family sporulation protein [Salinibacillus xinjiangensis]MRG87709.1 sporulation protein YtfJ [Salinibacillus xinjiangensis]
MSEHPIQGLMTTAMESLKEMVDVNTIIGDPIETPDGSTIILPVSRVGFGFAAGGSEFKPAQKQNQQSEDQSDGGSSDGGGKLPFGGGSGGGVSITPVAFVIVNSNGVKMVHLNENTHLYERLIDLAPQAVDKIQDLLKSQIKQPEGKEEKSKEKEKDKDKDKEKDQNKDKEKSEDQEKEDEQKGEDKKNTPPSTL